MRRDAARILDEFLVASAQAGDRAAFGRLAERWRSRLIAHAYRLTGDSDLAGDIAQDAWADIIKGLPRLNDTAVFPAWAYRIVTRRAADAIRGLRRRRALNAVAKNEAEIAGGATAPVESGPDAVALIGAMEALAPDHRAAVGLFYLEDFSVAEIAAALDVPAGTVKTRLMHARRKLRAALEGGS